MALFWNLFRLSRTGYRMQTGSLYESMLSMRMLLKLQPGHTNKGSIGQPQIHPLYGVQRYRTLTYLGRSVLLDSLLSIYCRFTVK